LSPRRAPSSGTPFYLDDEQLALASFAALEAKLVELRAAAPRLRRRSS
jgi:hypothetical protein